MFGVDPCQIILTHNLTWNASLDSGTFTNFQWSFGTGIYTKYKSRKIISNQGFPFIQRQTSVLRMQECTWLKTFRQNLCNFNKMNP
jgi:hypothetical protein